MYVIGKKYSEKNNKVNIIQHEGNQADLINYIISGKIDLAITYNLSLPKNISFIPLINVPPHILVNANHKFAKFKELLLVLSKPYEQLNIDEKYSKTPQIQAEPYKTYCGT